MGPFAVATTALAALAAVLPGGVVADKPYYTDLESYQAGDAGEKPEQRFHSSSIRTSLYQINYWDPSKIDTTAAPYMFMAGKYGKWGPSIVSSKDLSLIWADQSYNSLAQVAQTYDNWRGQRVLVTYSEGRVRIYDESYRQLYVYDARGDMLGFKPDSHEASLTHDGNILLFACPSRPADLTPVGGPMEGKISDCTIQEIEPESGQVVFQWATSEYFKPEDSVWPLSHDEAWDYCHLNSIEKV